MMSKMMITCGYDDKDDDYLLPVAMMKKMPAAMMTKMMITCGYDDKENDYLRL